LDDTKQFVPILKSKEYAMKDFSDTIRNKNFTMWSSVVAEPGQTRTSKHIIVDDLTNFSAQKLIQMLYVGPSQTSIHVHVFYNPNEVALFHTLFQDF
jgi:hypothetical protein